MIRVTAGLGVAALMTLGCSFDEGGYAFESDASVADASPPNTPDAPPTSPDAALPAVDAPTIEPGVVLSTPAPGPLNLDADSPDWPGAIWYTLDIATAAQRVGCGGSYSDSAAVQFASMHDAQFIYFFFEVTDDVVNADSTELFEDDAIHLYLDAAGDRLGPFGFDDHELVISADEVFFDYATGASDVTLQGDLRLTGTGYNLEIRLVKSTLGAGSVGPTLGFDLAVTDDDDLGNTDAECYGLWYESPGPYCVGCCGDADPRAWCDTRVHGILQLL